MGYGMDDGDWADWAVDEDEKEFKHKQAIKAEAKKSEGSRIKSLVKQEVKKNLSQKPTRGAKVKVECLYCQTEFEARKADRERGWAKFCSKSCKAKKQSQRNGGRHG